MNTLISPLSIDSLDVNLLTAKIKKDLIDNNVITDVNYEGSNISILTQIIAYTTQNINAALALNSNQTNLLLTNIRQNAIYESQKLGYNITRPISSKMQVTITANSNVTIPQYSKFKSGDYTFLNTSEIILTTGQTSVVTLIEGTYIDYTIDSNLLYTPTSIIKNIILPYANIEEDNLFVEVNKNNTGFVNYSRVDTKFDLDLKTSTFYTNNNPETEYVNVYFAYLRSENSITTNDTVKISFILSNGSLANGLVDCTSDYDISITIDAPSSGGSDVESIESIKENAPRFYNTGNRTVNENDYVSFLIKNSIVKIANAWGGEKEYPKRLGYTYLTVIPETSRYISDLEEASLIDYLTKPKIIATGKVFKQPNYLPINISIKVLGNVVNLTSKQNEISNNIQTYFNSINNFNTFFYENKIKRIIEKVFENDNNLSVTINISPKLRLDYELFSIGNTTDIYIPNSNKKFYLQKNNTIIDLPENYTDIESYIANGWIRIIKSEEDLGIDFTGIVNSKVVTLSSTVSSTIVIDTITYDYYDLSFDNVVVGKWIPDINILRLDDISADITNTQYIDLTYTPEMNVISEKSTIFELGSVTYL